MFSKGVIKAVVEKKLDEFVLADSPLAVHGWSCFKSAPSLFSFGRTPATPVDSWMVGAPPLNSLILSTIIKLITILGAATLALLTSSCMEQHVTLSINKDGSGTITETSYFGEKMVAEMARAGAQGKDPLDELIGQLKQRLTAMAPTMGEGVSLTEAKPLNEDGKIGMVSVFEFKDINKLKYNPAQSLGNGPAMAPEAPLDIRYKDGVLTINNKHEHEKPVKDKQGDNEKINEQELMVIKEMMTDLRISLRLEFPGGIAETNAKHLDGNQFTMMDVNLGGLAKQEERLNDFTAAKPASMAAAMAILKDLDGTKFQAAEEITVKLK